MIKFKRIDKEHVVASANYRDHIAHNVDELQKIVEKASEEFWFESLERFEAQERRREERKNAADLKTEPAGSADQEEEQPG